MTESIDRRSQTGVIYPDLTMLCGLIWCHAGVEFGATFNIVIYNILDVIDDDLRILSDISNISDCERLSRNLHLMLKDK